MNLPNKITLFRIILIPFIIIIATISFFRNTIIYNTITLEDILILVLFLIAASTDFLDGYIARKYNLVTDFGKFMDPLADKLLVLSALIILLERGRMEVWGFSLGFVVTLILAREFIVTGIRLVAANKQKVIAASKIAKFKTVSQMIMIIMLLIDCYPLTLINQDANYITRLILITLSGVLTIVSGVDYFIKNKEIILNDK